MASQPKFKLGISQTQVRSITISRSLLGFSLSNPVVWLLYVYTAKVPSWMPYYLTYLVLSEPQIQVLSGHTSYLRFTQMSLDSSVGRAMGYKMDSWSSIPSRVNRFFSTMSRLALGSNQPPIQWVTGAPSLDEQGPGREADHLPPSSAKVKNGGATPPLPCMSL
jgi:hypothetical protein